MTVRWQVVVGTGAGELKKLTTGELENWTGPCKSQLGTETRVPSLNRVSLLWTSGDSGEAAAFERGIEH